MDISIGQVWRDKDKRRDTTIEIIRVVETPTGVHEVVGLVVGTEEERVYQIERLTSRWTLVTAKKAQPVTPKYKTREQWLVAAIDLITKKIFNPAKFEVPEVRVSVGWPGGRGKKQGVRGQCFSTDTTTDKVAQIFVSPAEADVQTVLAVVAHELIHAVDDCKSDHKSGFIKIAREIGFLPKWTSSDNRTDELSSKLLAVAEKLGPYPHAAIEIGERPTVQKTYMVLLESLDCDECDDGYKLRMTQKWLDEVGAPLCPHHVEMVPQEK